MNDRLIDVRFRPVNKLLVQVCFTPVNDRLIDVRFRPVNKLLVQVCFTPVDAHRSCTQFRDKAQPSLVDALTHQVPHS